MQEKLRERLNNCCIIECIDTESDNLRIIIRILTDNEANIENTISSVINIVDEVVGFDNYMIFYNNEQIEFIFKVRE